MTAFTLQELGMAYRKAKVDLYYSTHRSLKNIANYESDLHDNLQQLLEKINGDDSSWIEDEGFLGDWIVVPHTYELPDTAKNADTPFFSSPTDKASYFRKCGQNSTAYFRLMAQPSIDFHVLSALWIMQVGHKFDAELSDKAYGQRLRRTQSGNFNGLSLGSFSPYMTPFRNWRDNGLKAMRQALYDGKTIAALTADVSSFYHELNPHFMLDDSFMAMVLHDDLAPDDQKLHELFIGALIAWAKTTPLEKGLPVGLPASAVVANLGLIELDRLIEQQVAPIYYGRYVDDIMLVMDNSPGFQSQDGLWQWLIDRSVKASAPILSAETSTTDDKENSAIRFQPEYLASGDGESRIQFKNDKNKLFILSGDTGKAMVKAIEHQIHARASEHRALPTLPDDPTQIGGTLVEAVQSDGDGADNLRKVDGLMMRRARFALTLRDYEAYERDLAPEDWRAQRHAFLDAFTQQVMALPTYFELAQYLPRVVQLATRCEDFEKLRKLLEALVILCGQVVDKDDCDSYLKGADSDHSLSSDELRKRWREPLFHRIMESLIAAHPSPLTQQGKQCWAKHIEKNEPTGKNDERLPWPWAISATELKQQHSHLFSFDLAHQPFRFIGLPREMVGKRGISSKKTLIRLGNADALVQKDVLVGLRHVTGWTSLGEANKGDADRPASDGNEPMLHGLMFATRPYNLMELGIINPHAYRQDNQTVMQEAILALRGFKPSDGLPHYDKKGVLQVGYSEQAKTPKIAVTSWKTENGSLKAALTRSTDPDKTRYKRLNRLLNDLLGNPAGCQYLILPELAMPARWFIRIAHKLNSRGISLISGIEYQHTSKSRVRNQIWAALRHDSLGFPTLAIHRQNKQLPAPGEESNLHNTAKLKLAKDYRNPHAPPVICHGGLHFAMLICSELTNIAHRTALRGQVDALFVAEWNQDINTFDALVESAALDIHAYIIQCNNRLYGDSRIRAPYKQNWQRDILQVKGGIADYYVIGQIDVPALRQFQRQHRDPNGQFKPTPDGFQHDMAFDRKILPEGKQT